MSIDDELNERLEALPIEVPLRTRREMEAARLVGEVRQLFKDIADALLARRIPTETILMRSPVPSSKLKHYFLGDQSNPLVPGAEGWTIIRNWMIDTYGELWTPNRQLGYEGEWRKVDLTWWQNQFSREEWHGIRPFLHQSGHQINLLEEAGAPSRLTLYSSGYTMRSRYFEGELRDGLLQATAELIADHSA